MKEKIITKAKEIKEEHGLEIAGGLVAIGACVTLFNLGRICGRMDVIDAVFKASLEASKNVSEQ